MIISLALPWTSEPFKCKGACVEAHAENVPSLHIYNFHVSDKCAWGFFLFFSFLLTSAVLRVICTTLHNTLRVSERDKSW